MTYIAVVQGKGGAGKTTLAVSIAGELVARGANVQLIDLDPQGSAAAWADPGKLGFPVLTLEDSAVSPGELLRAILSVEADFVVLDTPAGMGPRTGAALAAAELALVPCSPSGLDIDATQKTLEFIARIKRHTQRRKPELLLVPMRVDRRTLEGRLFEAELKSFRQRVTPGIGYRTAFPRAFTAGESLSQSASGSLAHQEIESLVDEMLRTLEDGR